MIDKFNTYDFLGYIVPGALVLWVTTILFNDILEIPFIINPTGDFGESAIFLVISYFIGHLVQAYGNIIEQRLKEKIWKGFPSNRLLKEGDTSYSEGFRKKLQNVLTRFFDIDTEKIPNDLSSEKRSELENRRRQELFNLAYVFIVQKGIAGHTEAFNGIYGLYRGLIGGAILSEVIFLIGTIKYIFTTVFISSEWKKFVLFISLTLFFEICRKTFYKRLERFGNRFADSVYQNFYAYYCSIQASKDREV